jgi:hypothetical protein
MLNEEVKRYRELSGDNNPYTPISRIGGYLDGYEKAMEQKTGWIPVEKRNPDKTGVYLVTIKYLNCENKYCYMIVKRNYYVKTDTWADSLVTAWMPLPEPARLEEDET